MTLTKTVSVVLQASQRGVTVFTVWRRAKIFLSIFVPVLLLGGYAGIWICRFNQWDSLTYITVVPYWMWALPGMLLSIIAGLSIKKNNFSLVVFFIWLLTVIFGSDETRGLVREIKAAILPNIEEEKAAGGEVLRLVSINCHGGNVQAAAEAQSLKPDLIFLQETPPIKDVEELVKRIYGEEGSFVMAESNALLGRGEFVTFAEALGSETIHARFKHQGGALLDLTNVKLDRSIPRLEIWKRSVREEMRDTRIQNRKAVRQYIGDYQVESRQPIRIVAGDFATPPGDDVFRPLRKAGLRDAFHVAGQGIGNTYPSDAPILRINQVWISPEAILIKTSSKRSFYSDHRILICDFVVPKEN